MGVMPPKTRRKSEAWEAWRTAAVRSGGMEAWGAWLYTGDPLWRHGGMGSPPPSAIILTVILTYTNSRLLLVQ